MRILVLGAGGFIGRRIVASIARQHGKDAVIAGVRRNVSHFDVEQRLVDATDALSVRTAANDVTHVVNSVMGSHEAIIQSALNVGALAADGTIERAIHLSSIAIFGTRAGRVRENDPPGSPADGYAAAKIEAERHFVKLAGSRGVILRPGLVYGPGSELWTGRIARLLVAGRLGPLGNRGEGTCALVHVDDVADAVVGACGSPNAGGHNFTLVAAPAPSWNRYLADLAKAIDVTPRSISLNGLRFERALAHPLAAISPILRRIGRATPDMITPGLARLFAVQTDYESTAVGSILPKWRDYASTLPESAAWIAKQ